MELWSVPVLTTAKMKSRTARNCSCCDKVADRAMREALLGAKGWASRAHDYQLQHEHMYLASVKPLTEAQVAQVTFREKPRKRDVKTDVQILAERHQPQAKHKAQAKPKTRTRGKAKAAAKPNHRVPGLQTVPTRRLQLLQALAMLLLKQHQRPHPLLTLLAALPAAVPEACCHASCLSISSDDECGWSNSFRPGCVSADSLPIAVMRRYQSPRNSQSCLCCSQVLAFLQSSS